MIRHKTRLLTGFYHELANSIGLDHIENCKQYNAHGKSRHSVLYGVYHVALEI
jgi:hypothetical protein